MLIPIWRQMGTGVSIAVVEEPDFVDSQSSRWVMRYRTGLETKSNFVKPFIWTTD